MTERKPPGRSWESWLDEQIAQARAEGAFDNLEGVGKPLADLHQGYDPDWWVKKLIAREKVSVLPPSLELLRKVEAEMARIWTSPEEAEVRRRVTALNDEISRVNSRMAAGPASRLAVLDVDAIVEDWRRRRATHATGPSAP
jgi:DnaJ-like protein